MSFVFSKNKEKRSRSSTGESNSSFVKNVTSRVSSFLPAGITKWFSSPSSSSGNGSAAIADGTDSSTEDEAPESPVIVQPPAKRLRYSSPPGKYSQLTTSETYLTSNVITETGSVLYNSIQSPSGRSTLNTETNLNLTPIRGINIDALIEQSQKDSLYKQHTVSSMDQSTIVKRKSLFAPPMQPEQIVCAKPAVHRMKESNHDIVKPYMLGSAFYHGNTMYGGAAAASSSSSSPLYIDRPNVKQQKMTYVNESKANDNINTLSKRVMDLLENYSSPLIEAKRIPRYELSELSDINRSIQPITSTHNPLRTQELFLPTTASVIRMKAKGRLMDSTKAARQIIASHSSTLNPYQTYAVDIPKRDHPDTDQGPGKLQSKLKSRLTRPNRGEDPFGMPEAVELPNAALQIDKNNLPHFSFAPSITDVSQISLRNKEQYEFSNPQTLSRSANETASQPPVFHFDQPGKAMVNTSPPKFSFGTQTGETPEEKEDEPVKKTEQSVIIFAKASNDWNCPDCWVSNKSDVTKCICCGGKKPSKAIPSNTSETTPMAKCTVCKLPNSQPNTDKCEICEKIKPNLQITNNNLPFTKTVSSKWKCGDCWVENEQSAERCICCSSRNPQKESKPPSVVDKFTAPATGEDDWRCKECLLTNIRSVEKCLACGGPQSDITPTREIVPNSIIFTNSNKKPNDFVEKKKSYWECRVCLANNPTNRSMCVCCEAERATVPDKALERFTNFKFSTTPNPGFKFGIDPKDQEMQVAEKGDSPKPMNSEESETNNNIVPKTPSFAFQMPSKNTSAKADESKINEAPKPSFSFGIPNQSITPASTSFLPINVQSPAMPIEEKQKPQEVPLISSFKAPEITNPLTTMFTSPTPVSNPVNAMDAFLNNSKVKKAVSPRKRRTSSSVETSKPFSFSALKPSTGGLFATPTCTAMSNSLTTQAAPANTLVMGMFPKSDAISTPAVPFFSTPEAKSTPIFQNNMESTQVPAAPVSATPLFSFGNNQAANSTPAPFSFGATTPAFGAAPQTNTGSFSLPTGNEPSNPLGGGNTLGSTGVGLTENRNTLLGSNTTSMFGAPAKENTSMWPNNTEQSNQVNPFMASATANPTFTFGATSAPSPFGAQTSNAPTPMFGAPAQTAQPAQNMFNMNQNTANQTPMFPNPAASQPAPMFGNSQPPSSMGMFGMATNPSPFGASNPSIPTFEAPATQQSTFNFGAPQATPAVFGFGQQPQQAQPVEMQQMQSAQQMQQMQQLQQMQQMQQPSMYSFGGGAPSPAGPVQFNMGSAPTGTAGRRVRKAVRRNPQR